MQEWDEMPSLTESEGTILHRHLKMLSKHS